MEPDGLEYHDLEEGKLFRTTEEVDQFVKNWGAKHISPFIIRSSFKGNEKANGRIQYQCPHAVNRDTRSKGDRPLQHVMYSRCPAMINVVQNRKEGIWRVTKLIKSHEGHMLGPDVYGTYQKVRKLKEKDIKSIADLDGVGAARRRVASALSEKTGMHFTFIIFDRHDDNLIFKNHHMATHPLIIINIIQKKYKNMTPFFPGNTYGTKDIYNAVSKMKKALGDEGNLEKYLADVQLEGGKVNYQKNQAGKVSVLWVQTRTMRQDVERSKPWSWQTDTTFSTNR